MGLHSDAVPVVSLESSVDIIFIFLAERCRGLYAAGKALLSVAGMMAVITGATKVMDAPQAFLRSLGAADSATLHLPWYVPQGGWGVFLALATAALGLFAVFTAKHLARVTETRLDR